MKCRGCDEGTKKGEQCAQEKCRRYVAEAELTPPQKKSRLREFVCLECQEKGYSLKDLRRFLCREPGCGFAGGRGRIQESNFERDYEKEQVRCIDCACLPQKRKR